MDGDWSPEHWEKMIDGKSAKSLVEGTGKYRYLHVPSDDSLNQIMLRLPNSDADWWARHPIWFMAARVPVRYEALDFALNSLHGPKRRLIWAEELSYEPWSGHLRLEVGINQLRELERNADAESLTALIALTLEARAARQYRLMYRGAQSIYQVLPAVIETSAQLHAGWPALVSLLDLLFWSPPLNVPVSHAWPRLDIARLRQQLWATKPRESIARTFAPASYLLRVERTSVYRSSSRSGI